MRVVVASGKGGTGKTTVATSLVLALSEPTVSFMDCDVEAPNGHIFLDPAFDRRKEVGILIPEVDMSLCTHCGICAEVCQYNAIAVIGTKTLVFPELCHGCGSCTTACPEQAISERLDVMGVLEGGDSRTGVMFSRGLLDVGEPMAVPVIRELKKWPPPRVVVTEVRDAPPGASCPVVESMRGADFVLLVTEPTPFGLHDLKQVAQVVQELGLPAGVVVNRDGIGDDEVDAYCRERGLPILMRIPYDRKIGEGIARGLPLVDIVPAYWRRFRDLSKEIASRVAGGGP